MNLRNAQSEKALDDAFSLQRLNDLIKFCGDNLANSHKKALDLMMMDFVQESSHKRSNVSAEHLLIPGLEVRQVNRTNDRTSGFCQERR